MNKPTFVIDTEFRDSDLFTTTARDWQADFVQLDRGPFLSRVRQIGSEGTQVGECSLNRKMQQNGVTPRSGRTFIIQRRPFGEFLWRKHHAGPNHLLCAPVGADFESVSPSAFQVFALTVPWETIACVAASFESRVGASLLTGRDIVELPETAVSRLRRRMGGLLGWSAPLQRAVPGAFEGYQAMREEVIREVVALWLSGAGLRLPPVSRPRDWVVRQALDYIAKQERKPITVNELCQIAGVSERTMQYAFKERFQTTPKQYLLAKRLQGVRSELRARPRARICDVASSWGFPHWGQFAAIYRAKFGELPSGTVRSSERREMQ